MKKTLLILSLLVGSASFAQVTIGTGTNTDSNTGLSTPIAIWYGTSLSQFVYLASEVNASGNITALEFKLNNALTLTNSNDMLDVWIGHTTRSEYNPVVGTAGADWIPLTGHTQVMTNGTLTQNGTTVIFTLTTPFAYNGIDNLVITVDANEAGNDGSSAKFLQTAASTTKTSLMIRTDVAAQNANPLNPPLNYTGTTDATSVQAKNTRPIITIQGLTALGTADHQFSSVAIYPNPVKNNLYINSQSNAIDANIYSLTGQLVLAPKVSENKIVLDNLASGIYIVKLNLEDGTIATQKFVKE